MKSTAKRKTIARAFVHIGRAGLEIHAGIAGARGTRLELFGRVRGTLSAESLGAAVRAALERSRSDRRPPSVGAPEVPGESDPIGDIRMFWEPPIPDSLRYGAVPILRRKGRIVIGMWISTTNGLRPFPRPFQMSAMASDVELGRAVHRAIVMTRTRSL